jgi:hypothetical protein
MWHGHSVHKSAVAGRDYTPGWLTMGEAKRRRRLGLEPIPIENLKVKAGQFIATIDIVDCDPLSVIIPIDKLAQLIAAGHQVHGAPARDDRAACYLLFRGLVTLFRDEPDKRDGAAVAMAAMAFRHPTAGKKLVRGVSAAIAKDGAAHMSISADPRGGLAITLGSRFADLRSVRDAAARFPEPLVIENSSDKQTVH